MGYCYELRNGRRLLCCDSCGHAGGVRKVPCKHDYCPAVALCADCRKSKKAGHDTYCDTNCAPAAAEFAAREERKAALLDAGEFVLSSASMCGDEMVAATFTNADGEARVYVMDSETYDTRSVLEPVTVAFFEARGRVAFRARCAA